MNIHEALETVWNYLRIENKTCPADVIFLFGGATLYPVFKAAELYKAGVCRNIVFVSNRGTFSNPEWKDVEAKMYAKTFVELGIPKNSLFYTPECSNTLEEARFAIPFMEKNGLHPKKIILISRPTHQRRAFATFKKQNPDIVCINVPADEPFVESQDLIDRMVAEIKRLQLYGKKGDIVPQEILQDVKSAWKILKNNVKRIY